MLKSDFLWFQNWSSTELGVRDGSKGPYPQAREFDERGKPVRDIDFTEESLHPDLDHQPPIGPHWDYTGPKFPGGARLYPDGTWASK